MSSGIPGIWTMRARHRPIAAPMTMATSISVTPPALSSSPPASPWMARPIVAARAIAMPEMPNQMPGFADSCFDRPARLRMNSRAATMYAALLTLSAVIVPSPLRASGSSRKHPEHPTRHREPTEDVDARQQDRDERQRGDGGVAVADLQQGADDDDPGDRVRHRHQRRVQRV